MDEGDMNVCLEFSPIKFDNESDDPRHKGRIDGRGGGSTKTMESAMTGRG